MQLKKSILSLLITIIALCSFGQDKNEYTQSRILILLDESSSMIQKWSGGREKIKVANDLILKIMDSVYSVNEEVEFSLRVFGNQHTVPEHDCNDTKNEVAFSKYNKTQMEFRLEDLHPLGVTPIAYALSEAAYKDLTDEKHNAYSIILITDGGESCGGDICDVMMRLIKNKVYFRPYILNLEEDAEVKKEYSCMGDYLQVTKTSDIPVAVGAIVEAFRPMLKISKADYKVLQNISVPSPLKVKTPIIKPAKIVEDTPVERVPAKDTVAIVPKKEPVHKIEASDAPKEEPKRPVALKMKRISYNPGIKMYYYTAKIGKPYQSNVSVPEIKFQEPEVIPVRPTAAKLTKMEFRPLKKMKITRPEPFTAEPLIADVPVIKFLEPEVVKVREQPAKLTLMEFRNFKKLKTTKPVAATQEPVAVQVPDIKFLAPDVVAVRPTPAQLTPATYRTFKKLKTSKPELATQEPINVAIPEIKFLAPDKPPVVKPEVLKLTRLKPTPLKMHLLYGGSFFDTDLKPLKLPPAPQFKPLASTTTAPTTPKPGVPKTPPAKTGEYTVDHTDAKETTLEVYLTNGKGKFYNTTPQIVITDPGTNKELKKFYRFVDGAGNPDPISDLKPGQYDLTIVGRDDLQAHVDLQPHKTTKVYIKVKNYSLYFYYAGAPDRPVKEFKAMVIQRNQANGREVVQQCTEKLEYEPGNYHIMISTFPEDVRNIDLSAESAGGIAIDQPGWVKFTPEVNVTSVTLWKQSGDKFLSFHTIELSDPSSRHLQIQPGRYQVQYNNGTSKYSTSDRVIPFEIKSNVETEVKLVK